MPNLKKLILKALLVFAKPTILFESKPILSDNTMPVYLELLRRGYGKKYYLLWNYEYYRTVEPEKNNIGFHEISQNSRSLLSKLKFYSSEYKIKAVICCNEFILKGKVPVFYLMHGSPLKDCHKYYFVPDEIKYCLAASEEAGKGLESCISCKKETLFSLGYPRNDILCRKSTLNLSDFFGNYGKFIVWYPTFRQYKNKKNYTNAEHSLPIIHDLEAAIRLNECAAENNTLIILKPHYVQDISLINDFHLDNIRFITDNFFTENNITSYEFIAACDALLSDYSSIYYDFLLCNKPVGLIWEDIEEYKQNPGLIENYEYYCKGGEKIYTADDLCAFVSRVANNIDTLSAERNEICDIMNYSRDGKSTQRVVDYIVEKAHL